MRIVRVSLGILLVLAGVTGLVLSLITIYVLGDAAVAASQQTTSILDSTKEGVVFLSRSTAKVQFLLKETKARTLELEATLNEVKKKVEESPSRKTPLHNLDQQITAKFRKAHNTVVALQGTLDVFSNTLILFNSIPGLSKPGSKEDVVSETQELSRSLTEATETLDQISQFLNDILSDREVTQQRLDDLTLWVKQIQAKLARAEQRVDTFNQRLSLFEERLSSAGKTIPSWIEKGSVYAVVMLACFACTQIGLLLQALALFRKNRNLPD